jgi:PAS domain-containing protein
VRDRRLTPADTIALLEATLEASQDGILVADLNRQVVYCNGQYLRMFGLTRELVAGGVDAIVAAMLPQIENADYIVERSQAVWSEPELEVADLGALQRWPCVRTVRRATPARRNDRRPSGGLSGHQPVRTHQAGTRTTSCVP